MLKRNTMLDSITTTRTGRKKHKRKSIVFFGCFLVISISFFSMLMYYSIQHREKESNSNLTLNNSFKAKNYPDGVKLVKFFEKNGSCFAELNDKSIYFCFIFRKEMTFKEAEKILRELNKVYGGKFLDEFLKELKEY